jgi:hypothetical protein
MKPSAFDSPAGFAMTSAFRSTEYFDDWSCFAEIMSCVIESSGECGLASIISCDNRSHLDFALSPFSATAFVAMVAPRGRSDHSAVLA